MHDEKHPRRPQRRVPAHAEVMTVDRRGGDEADALRRPQIPVAFPVRALPAAQVLGGRPLILISCGEGKTGFRHYQKCLTRKSDDPPLPIAAVMRIIPLSFSISQIAA